MNSGLIKLLAWVTLYMLKYGMGIFIVTQIVVESVLTCIVEHKQTIKDATYFQSKTYLLGILYVCVS